MATRRLRPRKVAVHFVLQALMSRASDVDNSMLMQCVPRRDPEGSKHESIQDLRFPITKVVGVDRSFIKVNLFARGCLC